MTTNITDVQEAFTDEELGVSGEEAPRGVRALPPEVAEKLAAVQAQAKDIVKKQPLVAVGAAVVAGFIVGRIASRF